MTILVIAELDHAGLKTGTLQTVGAARQIGGPVEILVAGQDCRVAAEAAARIQGASRVILADQAAYADMLAEPLAALIVHICGQGNYSHILAPASFFGKNVLPRAAALMDSQMISDIVAIDAPDIFQRPIYAGNAFATVQSLDAVKFLTIRATSFDAAEADGGTAVVEAVDFTPPESPTRFVTRELSKSERPELSAARIVISGGRGLGSAENFKALLEPLADTLNAAIGASRAAVDAGYVPNEYQVGQTGKIVAPELYIAVGISGAIQHMAGMKDSKVIVAINKDPEAPIFSVADYGLVGDLFTTLPALNDALKA